MSESIATLVLIGIFLGFSFFLSGMEAGVFALSRMRIRQFMKSGKPQARLLNDFLDNPEDFFWTILVGNTLAGLLAFSLTVVALQTLWIRHPIFFWGLLLILGLAYYVFVDLLPKMLFRQFPNRLCILLIRPFRFVHLALKPLVFLVSRFAEILLLLTGGRTFTGHLFGDRNELRLLMQESSHVLSSEEKAIINRVLDWENLTVRSCCKPMDKVVTLESNATVDDVLRICRDTGLNRLPIWRKTGDKSRITNYVYLFPLLFSENLNRNDPVSAHARTVLHLRENTRLKDALRIMQEGGQRLAVVTGRDGRETGILTLQDLLRAIFGEVNL